MGISEEEARRAQEGCATYGELVSALYDRFAAQRDKRLAGEKAPGYVRRLPLLHAMFPGARTVHVIRDGRNVALSALDWASPVQGPGQLELWEREPMAACALWWKWQVEVGREDGVRLGRDRYLEVSYEALVADPEDELRRVCAFLGLSFEPEMVGFREGTTESASPDANADAPPLWSPGLRDWRAHMRHRDVELFEALAGDLLDVLGMERAFHRVSPAFARIASGHTRWWRAHLARREARERESHA